MSHPVLAENLAFMQGPYVLLTELFLQLLHSDSDFKNEDKNWIVQECRSLKEDVELHRIKYLSEFSACCETMDVDNSNIYNILISFISLLFNIHMIC